LTIVIFEARWVAQVDQGSLMPSRHLVEVAEYDHDAYDRNYSRREGELTTVRSSFYVYGSPAKDQLPLYRYLHPEFRDVFLTTVWNELAYGFAAWKYCGILGYVSDRPTTGSIRLYRWFNDRTGKHAYTTLQSPSHLVVADGWALEGPLIFVPDPSSVPAAAGTAGARTCAHPGCPNETLRSTIELCADHINSADIGPLLDATTCVDHQEKIIDLSGIRIHDRHCAAVSEWIRGAVTESDGWLLDLHYATGTGNLSFELPEGMSLDLSSAEIHGDLELRDCVVSRIILAGARINGSLVLDKAVVHDAIFADRISVSGMLRVSGVNAANVHAYFDHADVARIAVSDSKFGVLSFANCDVAIRSLVAGSAIDTLVCTGLNVAKDWALRQCSVSAYAELSEASVARHLNLEFNTFDGTLDLSGTSCGEAIHLADSRYMGAVLLNSVKTTWLDMHGSVFGGRIAGSDVTVMDVLDLRNSEMHQPVLIEADPQIAILDGAVFHRETTLQLDGTAVFAVRTRFDSRSRIDGSNKSVRLLDLTNTDLSNLQLDDADLTLCGLGHALNLEQIQFSGATSFATLPRHLNGAPWYRWHAARKVVWEEILLRARLNTPGWSRWRGVLSANIETDKRPGFGWALALPQHKSETPITMRRLSSIYRDLRLSQERRDEEAESNEFYYSEMTIRRQNANGMKRLVFNLYWLLGGYGVRPSRPVVAFVVGWWLIAVGFVQLHLLIDPTTPSVSPGYASTFRHLLRTATTIFGSSEFQPQGLSGVLLDLAARVLLPTLLALAFFGIRSHVRRGR
jgi:uncharacterized protein YjbI with pentapeptide repeats